MDPKRTRFRAYQLKQTGSLMSYATNENFTLIEARIGPWSRPGLEEELNAFNKTIAKFLIIYHNRSYGILNRF